MPQALRTDDLYSPVEQGRIRTAKTTVRTGLVGDLTIETSVPPTPGLIEALERLHEIKRLPAGWDSYSAAPTDPGVFRPALELVIEGVQRCHAPRIIGSNSGGVILLWEDEARELEIEVHPNGLCTVFFADEAAEEEVETDELTIGDAKALLSKFCRQA